MNPDLHYRLLGLADTVVSPYFCYFPAKGIAGIRLDLLALKGHSLAWFTACRITGKCINKFVFFVVHDQPALRRLHASRNRSLFRIVNGHDSDHCHSRDYSDNYADDCPGADTADGAG